MTLQVNVRDERNFAKRLVLDGRLDGSTAGRLDQAVNQVLGQPTNLLLFDFSDLEYISSAGLRIIFKTQKALAKRQGNCAFINMQPQIRRVFEIVNALPDFSVFASYEEMDDYLDAMQRQAREEQGGC